MRDLEQIWQRNQKHMTKIGCGDRKPCGDYVKLQIPGRNAIDKECTIGKTNL